MNDKQKIVLAIGTALFFLIVLHIMISNIGTREDHSENKEDVVLANSGEAYYEDSNLEEDIEPEDTDWISLYFGEYTGFFHDSGNKDELYQKLNHNPLDAYYVKLYQQAGPPAEESEVLAEWTAAYEKEISAAHKDLKKRLKEVLEENEENEESVQKIVETMDAEYKSWIETESTYLADGLYYARGGGSGYGPEIGLYDLQMTRQKLFQLAEILQIVGEFDFHYQYD